MAKYKYFKKVISDTKEDITLSANQFRLLALIDENKEIGLIVRESGMDVDVFKKQLTALYEMGLIVPVVKKTIRRYRPEFLKELTSILTYYVGPVADIIINDILSDMSITDRKLSVDDLEVVLSKITEELPDTSQKIEFNEKVEKLLLRN